MVSQTFANPPPGPKCNSKLKAFVDANNVDCRVGSGFSVALMSARPDKEEIENLCASPDCWELLDGMREASPTECVMYSGFYLYADLLNPILKQCATSSSSSNGSVPVVTGEAPFNGSWASTPTSAVPSPASTVAAPAATPNSEAADASAKLVNNAMTRGTIIAIISASVFVLSLIAGLVKFFYRRRQREKKKNEKMMEKENATSKPKLKGKKGKEDKEEEDEEEDDSGDDDDDDDGDFDFIATLEEHTGHHH